MPSHLSSKERSNILKLRELGLSQNEIATRTGRSLATVQRTLNDENNTRRTFTEMEKSSIRTLHRVKRWKQDRLAAHFNVSQSTINRIVNSDD